MEPEEGKKKKKSVGSEKHDPCSNINYPRFECLSEHSKLDNLVRARYLLWNPPGHNHMRSEHV